MPDGSLPQVVSWVDLRQAIAARFNLDELRLLCHDLNIDYDELGEGLRKSVRIITLLADIINQNRVSELLLALQEHRPNFTWPHTMSEIASEGLLEEEALAKYVPSRSFEPKSVYIPFGPLVMGRAASEGVAVWEMPEHEITLPPFRIGIYPITNEQYERFVRQTGHVVTPEMGWTGRTPIEGQEQFPVTAVTWHDAITYCEWLSEKTEQTYTLPSEAQWERVARGTDGRLYPWGNEWEEGRCNLGGRELTAVEAFPPQSPDGCYDLVGNIRQWTRSLWGDNIRQPDDKFHYPWSQETHDPDDIITIASHLRRIYRGSAYNDEPEQCRCTIRRSYMPNKPGPSGKRHGFRVVLI